MSEAAKSAVVAQIVPSQEAMSAVHSEVGAVLSMIERVARDPSVDIDRVERMMNLHRELRKEEAERGFNAAMVAVQARMPQVKRDANNDQTRSKYARLETISAAVDPIIAAHGLSLSFGTDTSSMADHYRIVCDVRHGAHKERYFADIPIDGEGMKGTKNKTDTHAFGSTMSYGRRYLKLMIFDISLTNEDNDGNRRRHDPEPQRQPEAPAAGGAAVITPDQVGQLRDAIHDLGETEANFCKVTKIKSLETIRADEFQAAKAFIANAGRSN